MITSANSSGTTTYSYNVDGQLTGQVSQAGTTTYQYNGLGQLVSESVNGTLTNFLVDPTGLGNLVGQFTASGTAIAQYAYGLGLVSQVSAAGSAYYNFDLTGNTTQLTGAGGAVVDSYSYLPFGELLSSTGSAANPFTFNGQYGAMGLGNGLFSMRNRVYDSGLGRFTSVDPLNVLGGDVDLYTFAENAPVEYVDPTGMAPFPSLTTPAPAFPSSLLGLGEKAGMGYALSTSVASNGLVKAFSGGPAALGLGLANTAGLNYAKDYYGWTEANSSFKNQALDLSITGLGFVPQTALPWLPSTPEPSWGLRSAKSRTLTRVTR